MCTEVPAAVVLVLGRESLRRTNGQKKEIKCSITTIKPLGQREDHTSLPAIRDVFVSQQYIAATLDVLHTNCYEWPLKGNRQIHLTEPQTL